MNFVDSVCDKNMFLCSYVKIILRCLRAKIFDNSVNFVDSVCDKNMFLCSYVKKQIDALTRTALSPSPLSQKTKPIVVKTISNII